MASKGQSATISYGREKFFFDDVVQDKTPNHLKDLDELPELQEV
jgi:hypothetical protein